MGEGGEEKGDGGFGVPESLGVFTGGLVDGDAEAGLLSAGILQDISEISFGFCIDPAGRVVAEETGEDGTFVVLGVLAPGVDNDAGWGRVDCVGGSGDTESVEERMDAVKEPA